MLLMTNPNDAPLASFIILRNSRWRPFHDFKMVCRI